MKWNRNEIERLSPILEQISVDLAPVDGKEILVLSSGTGEVAFWLGEMMEQGKITGVEVDEESLQIARRAAHEMGLEAMVQFAATDKQHIPLPDEDFEGLVSEFIVYPTMAPTEIGQAEMARVLKPGGKMLLTDVIITRSLPPEVKEALEVIGLDYLCEGSLQDFRSWMNEAGLVNVAIRDMTPTLRVVWESRREMDLAASHQKGYTYLLDDPRYELGRAIHYIYVRGEKPKTGR